MIAHPKIHLSAVRLRSEKTTNFSPPGLFRPGSSGSTRREQGQVRTGAGGILGPSHNSFSQVQGRVQCEEASRRPLFLASPAGQGPLSGVPYGMDKDKVKAARPRSGSLTEGRGTPARGRRSSTSMTQELLDEESRMARLAASAADKAAAHQRKMTDNVSRSRTPSPGGAGELLSGPRVPPRLLSSRRRRVPQRGRRRWTPGSLRRSCPGPRRRTSTSSCRSPGGKGARYR